MQVRILPPTMMNQIAKDWFAEVYPVTVPTVNWAVLIAESQEHLGKSITKKLDDNRIGAKLPGYLQAMGNLMYGDRINLKAFLTESRLLNAIHFGFLVISDPDTQGLFLLNTQLQCIGLGEFQVYHGSMPRWINAVKVCCFPEGDYRLRFIANRIFGFLEQAGFKDSFLAFERIALPDGTFAFR
jgi:hypothetical protein